MLAPTDIRSANKMSDADTFHEQVPDDAEGSDDAKEPADDAEPMDDDAVVDEKGKAEGSPRVRRKVPAHCGFLRGADGDESPGGAEKSADKKPGAKRDRAPKPLVPGTMIFPTARVKKMIKERASHLQLHVKRSCPRFQRVPARQAGS